MALVEPVAGAPAAVASLDDERALVVADYHAGVERALRLERGLEVDSRADRRREALVNLLERTDPDRLVLLGDVMHSIGDPGSAEREEVEALLDAVGDMPLTVVKGNHDGDLGTWLEPDVVTDARGVRIGDVGFVHGHTWPDPSVLSAETVCIGHEHPCVRLTDEVGASRVERVWLRGALARDPFGDVDEWASPRLVVAPAFNDLVGGTWVNVAGQEFLSPFLPVGIERARAFLLDGTDLGDYRTLE